MNASSLINEIKSCRVLATARSRIDAMRRLESLRSWVTTDEERDAFRRAQRAIAEAVYPLLDD